MNRRTFFHTALGATGGALVASALGCRKPVLMPPPEHILLITCDTTRWANLQVYGYARKTCPQIARLATQGVLFSNAFTSANETGTSHSVMLSGLYSFMNQAYRNGQRWSLPTGHQPLAARLAAAGYRTSAVTSMRSLSPEMLGDGFQHFSVDNDFRDRRGEVSTEIGLREIDLFASRGERSFTWMHYFDAHEEYHAPDEFRFQASPGDYSNRKLYEYDREIAYMDSCIGRVVDRLVARDLYRTTLIMVVSDHGEHFGEVEGLPLESHNALYEYIIRGLLVLGGGWTEQARVAQRLPHVYQGLTPAGTSVMPTILDAAGIPFGADELSGASLLPLIRGEKDAPTWVFGESDTAMQTYVRTDRHKLIIWNLRRYHEDLEKIRRNDPNVYGTARVLEKIRHRASTTGLELYDLVKDPYETTNIADSSRALADRLLAQAAAIRSRGTGLPPANQPSQQYNEALRALGYIGG